MAEFSDKVAIVTGAGQGIGRAIAEALAGEGASVVVNDADEGRAKEAAGAIVERGGRAVASGVAIGTAEAAEEILAAATDGFGRVDILVNNAGIRPDVPLVDMPVADIERSIQVNITGTILLTRAVAGRLVAAGAGGKIINITSRSGLRGKHGETVYSAGKAAIAGFTLGLSIELAPARVNVNAVAPAAWTVMLEQMPEPSRTQTIEKRKDNVLGRVAMPADVAPTVLFLASPRADYLTGQILEATGQHAALL